MYFLSSLSLAAGSDISKVCRLGFGVIHREFLSLWKVKVFLERDRVILRHQDWSVATVDMFSEGSNIRKMINHWKIVAQVFLAINRSIIFVDTINFQSHSVESMPSIWFISYSSTRLWLFSPVGTMVGGRVGGEKKSWTWNPGGGDRYQVESGLSSGRQLSGWCWQS